jgi:hypothetical protein
MADRWERQVCGLGTMQAPTERIWSKITAGPSGKPPPTRRHRGVALVVGLGLFVAIGIGVWVGLGPLTGGRDEAAAGGTEAVVSVKTPTQTRAVPEATLNNGRAVEAAALDEYMWQGESHSEPFPPKLDGFYRWRRGHPLTSEA